MINEALYRILTANSALAAVIGARAYPKYAPQNVTDPFVTYFRIFGQHAESHSGSSGHGRARYQFSVWSVNHKTAHQTAELVRLALEGYKGVVTDGGSPATELAVIGSILSAGDGPETYDEETGYCQVPVDYYVRYQETQPD